MVAINISSLWDYIIMIVDFAINIIVLTGLGVALHGNYFTKNGNRKLYGLRRLFVRLGWIQLIFTDLIKIWGSNLCNRRNIL